MTFQSVTNWLERGIEQTCSIVTSSTPTWRPPRRLPWSCTYGADKCLQLGRDLSFLARRGVLVRHRASVTGVAGMGFPKWVWSYRLPTGSTAST